MASAGLFMLASSSIDASEKLADPLSAWCEAPARGSAYGRVIRMKSGLGPGLAMVGNAARWSSV